jgi:large subunit ribosomal protein L9
MATEVLLMADVDGLGKEGSVVKVKDGYARNYLFPLNMAAPVNNGTRRKLSKLQSERKAEMQVALAACQALAQKIAGVSCTIAVKVAEGDRLYGSVGESEIVAALKKQNIDIDRHQVALAGPIKALGVFDVTVNLHPEVQPTLKVWVVEE